MATFQQLMGAAENAENAGDTDAARQLVGMAHSLVKQSGGRIRGVATDTAGTGNLAPTAYDPSQDVATPRVDRFGDTIQAAMKGPLAATKHFAGEVVDPENSIGERALAAGKTALSGAGALYALGAGTAGELFGGSPTQERKLARDLMMMGEVAAPELAGVSSATRLSGKVASTANKMDGKPVTEQQLAARAADDLGIVPSLGAGGKVRAQTAATLEKVPLASKVIENDATRFVDDVERAFIGIRQGIGEATDAAGAGEALQGGVGKFVERFEQTSRKLYDRVDQHIPKDMVVDAANTRQFVAEITSEFSDKPDILRQLGLNKFAGLANDMEGGLSWKAMKDLRSSIGRAIGSNSGPLEGLDKAQLRQMYGQLTQDMEAAVQQAGPKAEGAWKRANTHYAKGAERIQSALDKTIKADSPERAFEAFASMAKKNRSTSDIKRMMQIKKSMPKDEWNTVSASIVDRLGRATSGQQNAAGDAFSPAKFLTEWNNLSNPAKGILVDPKARVQLEKLARVAEASKRAGAERNHSNTGTIIGGAVAGGGLTTAPLTTISALTAANVGARVLTNERMLRSLNNMARGDDKLMKAIARGDSPFAQDAQTILRLAAADAASVLPAGNENSPPNALAAP